MADDNKDLTGPDAPTHEATTPPGENQPDPEKLKQSEEELQKPGAGH